MTIGTILKNNAPETYCALSSIKTPLKLDFGGIQREIEKKIAKRLLKRDIDRFVEVELAYRANYGDNRTVRRSGDSLIAKLSRRFSDLKEVGVCH
jgi:hypothetical protein